MLGGPSKIISPTGLPLQQVRGIGVGVIQAVDSINSPTLVTILIDNHTPAESLYSIDSSFAPFGPGGSHGFKFFYNNAQNVGGSIVTVDLDKHKVLSFTGQVSKSAPSAKFTNVGTRTHVGNINPPEFPIVEAIQINSSNSLTGAFPYYLSSLQTITPVLTSGDIIGSAFPSMSLSGGLYTQTAASSVSTVGIVMPVGSWMFFDWTSENTGTADWGPVISDGTNTYQFNMSSVTGNISLFKNGVDIYDVIHSVTPSVLHTFVFSITFLGGTSYRLKAWIDGTNYFDFTDSGSSLNPNHIYPAFKCTANQVKHLEMDFYGTCDNPLKLDNPSPLTAPVISAVTITYPLSISSGNFYADCAFTVGGSPQPWMEGIRVSDGTGAYIDLPQTSNNQYNALMKLTGNRTISAAFVDLSGAISTIATVGSATYPGVVTGSAGPGTAPVTTQGSTQFSYIENIGALTYDAVANIYLNSGGTSSSSTLAFIELVSAPTGTSTYTQRGTLDPNVSGSYQAIWNDLLNASTYDLGIRYVDTAGTRGSVTTIGTTAQPPIFVVPLPIPTGIPVAPVVQGGSVSLSALVSQVDNNAIAGSLQDITTSLTITNVPQDYSVDRLLWGFRKNAPSPPIPDLSIVKTYALPYFSGDGRGVRTPIRLDATGTYQPSTGNLVIFCFGLGDASLTSDMLGFGYTLATDGVHTSSWVYYKIWDASVDSFPHSLGSTYYTNYIGREVSGVNSSVIVSTMTNTVAGGPGISVPSGSLTSSISASLAIFQIIYLTNDPSPTTPTFTNGFVYDTFSSLDDTGSGNVSTVFSSHLVPTGTGTISTTGTFGSELTSTNWVTTFLLINQGETPSTYDWTDYSYTNLKGLPLPPQTQAEVQTYGQLAVGIPYDFSIQYVSTHNVHGIRTVFQSNYTSPIKLSFPGTVSTANLVVDSGFTKSMWGYNNAGPTGLSTKSGINLNWKFFNIDGINNGYIGKGSDAQGNNFLAVPAVASGLVFRAISEPITVATAQTLMESGYIDATTSSGGSTGGAYIAIVDYTGLATFTTIYAQKHQPAGQRGTIHLDTAFTVPGGVTQVCFMFHSDAMTISSGNLVFALPMLEQNSISTGYNVGPADASDGSTRTPLSVAQVFIHNTGFDASTISTSPTTTAATVVPTSGGGASTFDKQPQGSTRLVQPGSGLQGSVYVQTAFVATSPVWAFLGTYTAGTAISLASNQISVIPDDLNIVIAQQLFS